MMFGHEDKKSNKENTIDYLNQTVNSKQVVSEDES